MNKKSDRHFNKSGVKQGRRTGKPADRIKNGKKGRKNEPYLAGKIMGNKNGYAFLIPEDRSLEDLFIHPKNLNGAVDGDKVVVSVGEYRGRKEASVVRVVERGFTRIVGIADITFSRFKVFPFSKRFVSPVRVTGDRFRCRDGDVVECEIDKYPTAETQAEGRITARLGHITDIGIDNEIVLRKYGILKQFPQEAERLAKEAGPDGYANSKKKITDLRRLFTVTVDGESARDYDDAVSVEKENGKTVLYVHIADVSRFVIPGSDIDREAIKRGTSVYFPQFAIPMLPEALSNGECSLLPDTDRYAVTARIVFSPEGERLETSFCRSVIRSRRRLTYGFVNRVISGNEKADSVELADFIIRAGALADILSDKRSRAGGLEFDMPEAEFKFDAEGLVRDIFPAERGPAERMIEFFMISANEAVADYLNSRKIPVLYRTHGQPDFKKLEEWAETARRFGIAVPEIEYPITPEGVGSLARAAENSKYSAVLNTLLIKCMMRAEYTVENIGHFGLSSPAYTHFTSPIRRYPDLIVHRALLSSLGYSDDSATEAELEILAPDMSDLERKADDAENDINKFKKLEYLLRNRDEEWDAYINKITPDGMFIFLEKLFMTGFVSFAYENGDTIIFQEGEALGLRTGKKYRIGDQIRAVLYDASVTLLQSDFVLVHEKKAKRKSACGKGR